jgi:hypothetical protein
MKRSTAAKRLRSLMSSGGFLPQTLDKIDAIATGLEKPRKAKALAPRGPVAMLDLYVDSHPIGQYATTLALNRPLMAGEVWTPGPIYLKHEKGEHLVLKVRGLEPTYRLDVP